MCSANSPQIVKSFNMIYPNCIRKKFNFKLHVFLYLNLYLIGFACLSLENRIQQILKDPGTVMIISEPNYVCILFNVLNMKIIELRKNFEIRINFFEFLYNT